MELLGSGWGLQAALLEGLFLGGVGEDRLLSYSWFCLPFLRLFGAAAVVFLFFLIVLDVGGVIVGEVEVNALLLALHVVGLINNVNPIEALGDQLGPGLG